MISGAR